MSENTKQVSGPHNVSEMLMKNFDKLPDLDQKLLMYGQFFLGGNAGWAGLIANSLYRRVLNVQAARFASSLPMAVLPLLGTAALYSAAVSSPLLTGDLHCPSCAVIRGALIGGLCGGLYPVLLALPVNLGLAARYSSAPMPEKGTVLRYCRDISKPVVKKMGAVFLFQAAFGGYLGSRHFQSYTHLAQITFSKEEDLDN